MAEHSVTAQPNRHKRSGNSLNGTETAITDPQFAQCWTLDETGNWKNFRQDDNGDSTWDLNQTRTANGANEITDITATAGPVWADPVYNNNGSMTTIPRPVAPNPDWANFNADQWHDFTADQWSNLEVTNHFGATYDAWNRLVKLTDPTGTVQKNQYDGRNFRITKTEYTNGTAGLPTHFYYTNKWQNIEERVGTYTTPAEHHIWGVRYIDDLICRDRSTTSILNERLYALQDANWNITGIVSASGNVFERYEYDPYGNTTIYDAAYNPRTTSAYNWQTTYCGYKWDDDSGLFAVRFRYYSPKLGIWITRDPIGYNDGMSLYLAYYVPNGTDPSGLEGPGKNPGGGGGWTATYPGGGTGPSGGTQPDIWGDGDGTPTQQAFPPSDQARVSDLVYEFFSGTGPRSRSMSPAALLSQELRNHRAITSEIASESEKLMKDCKNHGMHKFFHSASPIIDLPYDMVNIAFTLGATAGEPAVTVHGV